MAQTIIARRVLLPSSPCAQRRNPCGALGLDCKSTAKQGTIMPRMQTQASWEARKRKKPLD
jgi:hypothetical protein